MGSATTIGDLAHARLPAFQRRIDRSLGVIQEAAKLGRIAVSVSGGKDSIVALDLVRQVQPDCLAVFFDSGLEYPWTYEVIKHYGVTVVQPERSLPEMLKHGGYWGYRGPELVDPEAEFDFFAFLITEPAQRVQREYGILVEAIGLRAEENAGRRIQLHKTGMLHHMKSGVWHLYPVAFFRLEDIWAYIASRKLLYNAVYDKMTDWGIPREQQRVSTLLGSAGLAQNARIAFIRAIAPDVFWRLAAEFPMVTQHA